MAKIGKILKIGFVSLLGLCLVGYIVYATVFLSRPAPDEHCTEIVLTVNSDLKTKYLDEKEIEKILKNSHLYPKGMQMSEVNTELIENEIRKNEFVAEVECYKASKGRLCIEVKPRIPVIYVAPEGRKGYFVDAQGKIIPNTNYVVNLVTASGYIDESFASSKLSEFGQYLQADAFWNNQIEQIYVSRNEKGQPVVELIPRVGDHTVYLGSIDDYQSKLQKLKIFYQKAMNTVGWNKYAKINLEYGNQIICTKRKTK